MFSRFSIIYGGSILLHAGVALAVVSIPPPIPKREPTVITMSTAKRKVEPPTATPPPPPPPPPVEAPAPPQHRAEKKLAAPKPTVAPPPTAAAPATAAASGGPVADFGLSLSGGVGAGGIAVPVGNPGGQGPARTVKAAAPKALVAKKTEGDEDSACLEALVKPKPISVPQPVYADAAREAGIEGKVRVELTVDETGKVVEARVLEGLGHGLDEAALDAARNSSFEPATRCGKATRTTFVIGIRFQI